MPLDRFVDRRDELAKRRRAAGERDEANRIKALKKPSAAAGIVNRVIRSAPDRRRALLKAADALRSAQADLQRGKADARRLRSARDDEREAVEALVDAARRLAGDGQKANEPTLERVRETLHAVALDPEARRQVEAARLTRELSVVGFGVATSAPPQAERRTRKTGERGRAAEDAGEEQRHRAESERAAAEDELESARDRAKEARAALSDARRQLQKAAAARDQAQRRLERAEAEAEGADGRVKSAREALKGLPRR